MWLPRLLRGRLRIEPRGSLPDALPTGNCIRVIVADGRAVGFDE